jgi:hypothetical protein
MKTAFVISPIGRKGTKVRRNADLTFRHVIEPACAANGLQVVRADRISSPGMITSQIITHIIEDDIVIADLTGRNPNVYYELAIRHALGKPVVQLIAHGESLPFDVAQSRTISVDLTDPDSVVESKDELIQQIQSAEANPAAFDTPLTGAINWDVLRKSDNPADIGKFEILEQIKDLKAHLFRFASPAPLRQRQHDHFNYLEDAPIILDCTTIEDNLVVAYYPESSSFQELLNSVFSDVMYGHVEELSYGQMWSFRHSKWGELVEKDGKFDSRELEEVGIRPGDTLVVELLSPDEEDIK